MRVPKLTALLHFAAEPVDTSLQRLTQVFCCSRQRAGFARCVHRVIPACASVCVNAPPTTQAKSSLRGVPLSLSTSISTRARSLRVYAPIATPAFMLCTPHSRHLHRTRPVLQRETQQLPTSGHTHQRICPVRFCCNPCVCHKSTDLLRRAMTDTTACRSLAHAQPCVHRTGRFAYAAGSTGAHRPAFWWHTAVATRLQQLAKLRTTFYGCGEGDTNVFPLKQD